MPASRVVTPPGPDATLSDPALGPTDAARGLDAGADRAGDIAVAFVQGDGDARRIVAASYDRAPGAFRANTTTKWRKFARPPLKWGTAFELWGPLTYRVEIDGQPVGRDDVDRPHRADPVRRRAASLARRRHRHPRPDRGDALAQPARRRHAAEDHASRSRGRASAASRSKVAVQATDASGTAAKASGLNLVHIKFGDGSRTVTGLRAVHRYGHSGKVTVRVSASDKAGNASPSRGGSRSASSPRRSPHRKSSQRADYRSSRRSCRPARDVGCAAVRAPSGEPELVRAAGGGGSRCRRRAVGRLRAARLRLLPAGAGRADAAADAAQDAFLLAHAELGSLARAGEGFGLAVFRAARTTCYELLARDGRRPAAPRPGAAASRPRPRACARSSAPRSP